MTNQHQATPDEWAQQEDWANRSVFSGSSCLFELRARIEALEATQQPLAFPGKVVAPIKAPITRDRDETGDYIIVHDTPALNSSPVERIATDEVLVSPRLATKGGTSNLVQVRSSVGDGQPVAEDDVHLYLEQ
jgi:hypothetical protein